MAGSLAVKVILGEDTNFAIADIKRAKRMVEKYVFYYGMSDMGITTWAYQPYSRWEAAAPGWHHDTCWHAACQDAPSPPPPCSPAAAIMLAPCTTHQPHSSIT